MATAAIPLPTNTPDGTGFRLYRQSGRPLPMYRDAAKTLGPIYYAVTGEDAVLYADTGLQRMRLYPPGALAYVIDVQVGDSTTPAGPDDAGDVTDQELAQALDALRAELAQVYARLDQDETVTGAWTFSTVPVDADGNPLGTGTAGTGGVDADTLAQALADLREEIAGAYLPLQGGGRLYGPVDFDVTPTVDGVPITTSGVGAIAAELGDNPADGYATVAERLDGLASAADQSGLRQALADLTARVDSISSSDGGGGGGGPEPTTTLHYVGARIIQPPPPPPVSDYTLIPTYPGPGRIRFGSNNGSTNVTGVFPGYHHAWWERVVYNTTGSPAQANNTRGSGTVREYYDSPADLADAGSWAQAVGWMARGMKPILSVKAGGFSLAQHAAGAANDMWNNLFAKAAALPAGYSFYLQFIHEPNAGSKLNNQDPVQQRDYRRASRTIMDLSRAAGTYGTKIVHTKLFLMSPRDVAQKDFRHWDAEIGDDGRTWVTDAAGNRIQYGQVIATDWYDPHVSGDVNPIHAGDSNRTFTQDLYTNMCAYLDRQGNVPRPIIVGEWGLYTMQNAPGGTEATYLTSGGVTVDLIISDAITIGAQHARYPVWDIAFWNSKDGRFDNRNMPHAPAGSANDLLQYAYSDNDIVPSGGGVVGYKLRAMRHVAAGDILRTPSGGPVLPSTPAANRIWTPNPAGNMVVSTPAA